MSVHVTSSLWKHSPHAGSDLLVLLAMGDQARDEGFCWLSVASLADRTRLDRSTVQRRLRALEEAGALVVVRDDPGRSRTYWIDTPATAEHDPRNGGPQSAAPRRRGPHPAQKGPQDAAGGPQAAAQHMKDTPGHDEETSPVPHHARASASRRAARERECPTCSSWHVPGAVCAGTVPAAPGGLRAAVKAARS